LRLTRLLNATKYADQFTSQQDAVNTLGSKTKKKKDENRNALMRILLNADMTKLFATVIPRTEGTRE
jgi:hypothetical protein